MEYKEPIKFQQERDFGQVFNATFAFIKQEYRKLGSIFIKYCGPLIVLSVIASSLYQYKTLGMSLDPYSYDFMNSMAEFIGLVVIMFLLSLATYTMILVTIYSYISLYIEKGPEGFNTEDVWNTISQYFFKILGANIVIGILVVIGMFLCFLPGIYLAVSLSMVLIAMIYEKRTFGDAFSRSFEITHARWWWTFLILIVIYIIIVAISMLFAIPAMILTYTSIDNFARSGIISDSTRMVLTAINVISNLVSYVLNVVPIVAIAFQFFAIVESKEKPSLMDKIDHIS